MKSVGLCFFGLSTKDLAVFDRVIAFVAKKGGKFHKCPASLAAIFIVNDTPDTIKQAQQQQKNQIIISVSDRNDNSIGDYNIKRPLLITRVMRAMEQGSAQWLKSNANETTQAIKSTDFDSSENKTTTATKEKGDFHALVVDDSAAIRKQLELELRETAITADYAVCGKEALEMLDKHSYDLIFLDIIMPDINGYEVCKELRKKQNYKRTPVIMLSGKTGPLDEVEGILAGATTYLLKPVKHDLFQKTLTRISRWLYDFAKA
jgi:CheY-like chemotaxis protein